MALTQLATKILRYRCHIESDYSLHDQMMREFAGIFGYIRLSVALGISCETAERILGGEEQPNMARLAYHLGFMPYGEPRTWRNLPFDEQPHDIGPRKRWTEPVMEYLRELFSDPSRQPDLDVLAWQLDSTPRRLRDAMRRNGIKILAHHELQEECSNTAKGQHDHDA